MVACVGITAPAAVSGTTDDVEPEASSAGAAHSCYRGSKLSDTVDLVLRERGNTM